MFGFVILNANTSFCLRVEVLQLLDTLFVLFPPCLLSESFAFWFLLISYLLIFIIHNWNVIVVLKARQALKANATDWKCDCYHCRMVWRCTECHPKAQPRSLAKIFKWKRTHLFGRRCFRVGFPASESTEVKQSVLLSWRSINIHFVVP